MPAKVGNIDRRRLIRRPIGVWLAYSAFIIACVIAARCGAQDADAAGAPPADDPVAADAPAKPAAPAAPAPAAALDTGDYFTIDMATYTPEVAKQLEGRVRAALSDPSVTEGSQAMQNIQNYYSQYFMRQMAQPDAGPAITELVYEALKNIETVTRPGTSASSVVQQKLPALISDSAKRVAGSPINGKYYRPTARINATLLLANLNRKPAQGGAPPVPETSVVSTLKSLYEDQTAPLGVRVMALTGLRRQAVLLAASNSDNARAFFLPVGKNLLDGQSPAGLDQNSISPEAHAFLQRYAVDIVRAMGTAEDHGWLAQKLTAIVADEQASPIIANHAARTLGELKTGLEAVQVTTPVVVAWTDRAATALKAEIDYLNSLNPPQISVPQGLKPQGPSSGYGGPGIAGGFGMPMGDYGAGLGPSMTSSLGAGAAMGGYPGPYGMGLGGGMGMGDGSGPRIPQPDEIVVARRRLISQFESLLLGLTGTLDPAEPVAGLASVTTDESRPRMDEALEALQIAVDEINNRRYMTRVQFMAMLQEQSKELDYWLDDHRPQTPEISPEADTDAETEPDAAPEGPQPDVAAN